MKKLTLVLGLVPLIFLLTGCWSRTKTAPTSAPAVPQTQAPIAKEVIAPTTTKPAAVAPVNQPVASNGQIFEVSIQNFAFDPTTLTIKAGDYVTWINDDPAPHLVVGNAFQSTTLNTGDSFKFRFTKVGTYDYSCSLHPSMSGQIIVQ